MSERPTNPQICERFRALLTDGAKEVMGAQELAYTKSWRNDLWRAFAEIEERLCPLEVETRRRLKAQTHE